MNTYRSLDAIQQDILSGKTSCLSITESYLSRISEHKNLNAFLEVYTDEALDNARRIDEKMKAGNAGKLAGMVIGIKDNICYKDHKVSAASKILGNFESLFSATVVERLIDEDAIIIGRLNCDEFAMGSTNENSAYGPVLNPLNTDYVPGGSSGGSAAAVAADLCLASLGSDTGGSIRQPASFCGVVGYKPSYGRVSRWGLIAYASSFDQIGPLTHNVKDAALIMEVISGNDDFDSTSSTKEVPSFELEPIKKAKVGYLKSTIESPALDPEIKQHILNTIDTLKEEGHEVLEIDFPYLDYVVPTYYVLTTAEASSNLSRYDGIHFGYRSDDAKDIPSAYQKSRSEGFGKEVQRRIMLGTFVLSAGYYDAYYTKAQKVRRLLSEKTQSIFDSCDFILSPTSPNTALKIGQTYDEPTQLYLEDIFTVHANIVGIPAVSLPTGKHSNGMPFGIQLMAPAFKDAELMAFANQIMNK
ncbi:MAG: Asp-tRNA(Asn)/Glu-tRNA(Gln) amidotransferase subunit GatA [Flavobacteriales bacterium]|nr:Asp-tRNA(Asn)/Glu-tRNA(Gln) amidotransferase subunit GatA [Flavobacteriales bacterium]